VSSASRSLVKQATAIRAPQPRAISGIFPAYKKGGVGGSTLPLARVGAVAGFSAALQCVQTSVFLNS
jgi:hypothetical protein